ncbi:MAG TPA: alanine racemase [Rhodocyclaceae bacterium]|nr:alanine racemase [Rhodocyclaceae bacterium]HRQ46308.1 alanine racemase [Rhodocyclaceae bacterium]
MRPARALIDLDALRHNYALARRRHGARALAVIKANAYGHGAIPCARALEADADGFAVAIIEEAIELRRAGITRPILVLEGVFEASELELVERHDLWIVVHHGEQVRMLETARIERPLSVWLKINSGMNRAGFQPEEVTQIWQRLDDAEGVGEIALMTHLARADEPHVITTAEQVATFDAATRDLPGSRSLTNSAGILGWPAACRDWARPGILLYGADPMPGEPNHLQPVMTLESRVVSVRELPSGTPIGYGARFHTERPTRVGLVAIGYADGYPRSALDGTPVAVDGIRTRLVGRVSMDMLTIDLTDIPDSGPGSVVELWGSNIPVNRVAESAGTISYELLCNVKRVRFEYVGNAADS